MQKPCALLFFVKYPVPGRVKTRLAADVGPERAAEIYRALVRTICAKLRDDAWQWCVAFDPAATCEEIAEWTGPQLPGGTLFFPQRGGDLGERLTDAFGEVFERGFEKAIAIGSDCVEIDSVLLHRSIEALDANDAVLGPTEDGGYYLIALKQLHAGLFTGIPWSTAETFSQTILRAKDAGLRVALLPPLRDVDTESDWKIAAPLVDFESD